MQTELDIVRDVSQRLDGAGIAFMLTKNSASETQMRDVQNLAATGCDAVYVENWTRQLDLTNLWRQCRL